MITLTGNVFGNIFLNRRLGCGATSRVISADLRDDLKEELYAVKFIEDADNLYRELANYRILYQQEISCIPLLNGYIVTDRDEKCGLVMPIGETIQKYYNDPGNIQSMGKNRSRVSEIDQKPV